MNKEKNKQTNTTTELEQTPVKARRNYKDSIFRKLFNNKAAIIDLYNALSGSDYPPDTYVKIVTLDNVIFGDRKNDLAFMIENRFIILIEMQSTVNPNMPLRFLVYIAKEFEKLFFSQQIYSSTLVSIPTPEIYVFYGRRLHPRFTSGNPRLANARRDRSPMELKTFRLNRS